MVYVYVCVVYVLCFVCVMCAWYVINVMRMVSVHMCDVLQSMCCVCDMYIMCVVCNVGAKCVWCV